MWRSLVVLPAIAAAAGDTCTATILSDTKCPDKAFRWTNESSWKDCCTTCGSDADCLAFAYGTKETSKNCHLKRAVTSTKAGKGTTCGIFPGGGPTPSPAPRPGPRPPAPAPPSPVDPSAARPHFVFFLQDDLGWDDIGFHNPESKPYTPSITALAQDGIVLTNHYVHWHCSPTRRSFLTGRLPIHHGEMLSGVATDDIDLRWSVLSQKLAQAGYRSLWYGKGHTGYMSMAHLPTHRGFDHWTGFFQGAQSYTSSDRWKDGSPYANDTYATYLYGDEALAAVSEHDPTTPLMLYMPMQAVHEPYNVPPDPKPEGTLVQQMIWAADKYVGQIVALMKAKGMWKNTLVVYSADNGGTNEGTNWPKRGQKHTSWQGGMNVAAFVSGGFLPQKHRGSTADVALHIVDWYATFCVLAGVDPQDNGPQAPYPIDPSLEPTLPVPLDIYGDDSWAAVDGVDVWSILLDPERRDERGAAHKELTLSREVLLLNGTLKVVVAQPDPSVLAMKKEMPPHNNQTTGWRYRNHTWFEPEVFDQSGCGLNFIDRTMFKPCVFNIAEDPREMNDLSQTQPGLLADLWGRLNRSFLTYYHSRTPASMLGHCDKSCATDYWKGLGSSKGDGPICGVPGCDGAAVSLVV